MSMSERPNSAPMPDVAQNSAVPVSMKVPTASVVEFYKAQWADMQDIWRQSWDLAKIVLLVGGVAGTAIQALGSTHSFRWVASLSIAALAFIGLLTQNSLGRRVVEKRTAIKVAEVELGLTSLIERIPDFREAKSRLLNTSLFLSILHFSASIVFFGIGLHALHGYRRSIFVGLVAGAAVVEIIVAWVLSRLFYRARERQLEAKGSIQE